MVNNLKQLRLKAPNMIRREYQGLVDKVKKEPSKEDESLDLSLQALNTSLRTKNKQVHASQDVSEGEQLQRRVVGQDSLDTIEALNFS